MTQPLRNRLLQALASRSSRYESALETRFGRAVHAELTALFLAGHIEADAGERRRWRLTTSGQNQARAVAARRAA